MLASFTRSICAVSKSGPHTPLLHAKPASHPKPGRMVCWDSPQQAQLHLSADAVHSSSGVSSTSSSAGNSKQQHAPSTGGLLTISGSSCCLVINGSCWRASVSFSRAAVSQQTQASVNTFIVSMCLVAAASAGLLGRTPEHHRTPMHLPRPTTWLGPRLQPPALFVCSCSVRACRCHPSAGPTQHWHCLGNARPTSNCCATSSAGRGQCSCTILPAGP
jgi:hypothetical protein